MTQYSKEQDMARDDAARWLRALCAGHGGQLRVSQRLGVAACSLSKICTGAVLPSLPIIVAAVDAYDDAPDTVRSLARWYTTQHARLAPPPVQQPANDSGATALDRAFDRARTALGAGLLDTRTRVARVVRAASAYGDAVEADQANRVLVAIGEKPAPGPSTQEAALALYEAIRDVPELASLLSTVEQSKPAQPPATVSFLTPVVDYVPPSATTLVEPEPVVDARWSNLAKRSRKSPLLIVGGTPVPERLEWLRAAGINAEWIATSATTGNNLAQSAAKRVRGSNVSGVVVIHGLLSHRYYQEFMKAARFGLVPSATPRGPGVAEFEAALTSIEATWRSRAA